MNRFRTKMVQKGDMMNKDDILEILAIPLLGVVPDHEDVIVSANRGMPAAYDDKSIVGEAYRRIARKIAGEQGVPDLNLDDTGGFWSTIKRWMGFGEAREVAG